MWSPDKVRAVFEATQQHSPIKIPYTYRHPENSLPVLGYTNRDSVQVFEEHSRTYLTAQPADFAKEWIASLKKIGFDKVSVGLGRLGEIVHIGITDNPAVSGLGLAFEATEKVPPVYTQEVDFEAKDLDSLDEVFEVSWKWQLNSWMSDVASLFQRLRDREIEQNGVDAAEQFMPSYLMDWLKKPLADEVLQENKDGVSVNQQFENDMSVEEKEELERLRTENAALLTKQAEAEALRVQGEIAAFCAANEAVVTPRLKDAVIAILTDLHGAQPRQFEVDGKQVQKTSFEAMKELLAGAKPQVVFEEVATGERSGAHKEGGATLEESLQVQYDVVKR